LADQRYSSRRSDNPTDFCLDVSSGNFRAVKREITEATDGTAYVRRGAQELHVKNE